MQPHGLTFLETVAALEPRRLLKVTVITDPARISKAIMDEHIVNGHTRLSLVSHFCIHTPINWHARLWATWLMSDVLREELQSLQKASSPA